MTAINKDSALEMMKEGKNDVEIAGQFGKSRQAINLLRQSFIKLGLLDNALARASKLANYPNDKHSKENPPAVVSLTPTPPPLAPSLLTFDQISDWMVQIIKDAAETRELRSRCETLEKQITSSQSEIRKLRIELQEMTRLYNGNVNRANEFQQAIRKLGLPPGG
jgi:hypothetical protein